jgi:hypothetical protein
MEEDDKAIARARGRRRMSRQCGGHIDTMLFWGRGVGLKTVEHGRDKPNIVFTFTFEYGNEIGFGKVGIENESEHTGYRKRTNSIGNMSNTVGIRKLIREHRHVESS